MKIVMIPEIPTKMMKKMKMIIKMIMMNSRN